MTLYSSLLQERVEKLKSKLFEISLILDGGDMGAAVFHLCKAADGIVNLPLEDKETQKICFKLDDLCVRAARGLALVKQREFASFKTKNKQGRRIVVYLATRLYAIGGHTAVIEDLISAQPGKEHLILLSEPGTRDEQIAIDERIDRFRRTTGIKVRIGRPPTEFCTHTGIVHWLAKEIVQHDPQTVFLFHHPTDVGVVVGGYLSKLITALKTQARNYFVYHHADIIPSIGIRLPGVNYITFKATLLSRWAGLLLSGQKPYFLPLTLRHDSGAPRTTKASDKSPLITASCGTANKMFSHHPGLDMASAIAHLIKSTRGKHFHIGPMQDGEKIYLQSGMKAQGLDESRLIFLGETKDLRSELLANGVDILLDTVPLPGSRTVIEALSAGIPVLAYNGNVSCIGSSAELLPEGSITWENYDDLERKAAKLDHQTCFEQGGRAREHFIKTYSFEQFSLTLGGILRDSGQHLAGENQGVASHGRTGRDSWTGSLRRILSSFSRKSPTFADDNDPVIGGAGHINSMLIQTELSEDELRIVAGHADRSFCATLDHGFVEFTPDWLSELVLGRGLAPTPLFDPVFYQLYCLDDLSYWGAPYLEYVRSGIERNLKPHAMIDPAWIQYISASDEMLDPIRYLQDKHNILVDPHPLFDSGLYLESNPDVARLSLSPMNHYLSAGYREQRTFNPIFDYDFYRKNIACPVDLKINLAAHYLVSWKPVGLMPHPLLDCRYYLSVSNQLREGVSHRTAFDPLSHYYRVGKKRNLNPNPLLNTRYVEEVTFRENTARASGFDLFVNAAHDSGIDPHPLFSSHFYVLKYQDINKLKLNPLSHFLNHGALEDRRCYPDFNVESYRKHYLSTRDDLNPVSHFLTEGLWLGCMPEFMEQQSRDLLHLTYEVALGSGQNRQAREIRRMLAWGRKAPPFLKSEVVEVRSVQQTRPPSKLDSPLSEVWLVKPRIYALDRPLVACGLIPAHEPVCEALEGVYVFGGTSVVIGEDGYAISSRHAAMVAELHELRTPDTVKAMHGRQVALTWLEEPIDTLPEAIHLCHEASNDLGVFLLEVLPRYLLAHDRVEQSTQIPLLVDGNLRPLQRAALELVIQPGQRICALHPAHRQRVLHLHYPEAVNWRIDYKDRPWQSEIRLHRDYLRRVREQILQAVEGIKSVNRPSERPWIYLKTEGYTALMNQDQLQETAYRLGFQVIDPAKLGIVDLVRLFQESEVIVGPHAEIMSGLLFASVRTRVFILADNSGKTDFRYWSTIAEMCGVNLGWIMGWEIRSTSGDKTGRQLYSVPVNLFDAVLRQACKAPWSTEDKVLDALFRLEQFSTVLTGASGLVIDRMPDYYWAELKRLRKTACREIEQRLTEATPEQSQEIMGAALFQSPVVHVLSAIHLFPLDEEEAAIKQAAIDRLADEGCSDRLLAALLQLFLLAQSYEIPLLESIDRMEHDDFKLYMSKLTCNHYFIDQGDDAAYRQFSIRFIEWLLDKLRDEETHPDKRNILISFAGNLYMGDLLTIDQNIADVLRPRAELIGQLKQMLPRYHLDGGFSPRNVDKRRRIRVGVLCRSFRKGPDSESVYAEFSEFDPNIYELYAYTIDYRDKMVKDDKSFNHQFETLFPHRRIIGSSVNEIVRDIRADQLDIFVLANATTFGIQPIDIALSNRVAPIQIVLNNINPVPTGLPSFDYFVTNDSPNAHLDPELQVQERALFIDHAPICFLKRPELSATRMFGRAELGISQDETVFYSAAAAAKLRYRCLHTFISILARSPRSRLVLGAFNPGWSGRYHALPFEIQLTNLCAELGVDRDRIITLTEMTMDEAHQVMDMIDVYLAPFPHGGATSSTMAIEKGKPVLALRRESTRSVDEFIMSSLGISETLAMDTQAYIALGARLGEDAAYRDSLRSQFSTARQHAPFYDRVGHSRALVALIGKVIAESTQAAPKMQPFAQNGPESPRP